MTADSSGQDALPGLTVEGVRPGRLEQAVAAAIDEAVRQQRLTTLDRAMAQLAIEAARAVDQAVTIRRDPYAFAQPARELRETLTRLQLDPTARGATGRDKFGEWLDEVLADNGTAGAVRDPA